MKELNSSHAWQINAIDQKRFYSNKQAGNKIPALMKLQLKIEYSAKYTKEKFVAALVDTGAQCNHINAELVKSHGLSKFVRTKRPNEIYNVQGFNGNAVRITEGIVLRVSIGKRTFNWSFDVTPNLTNPVILGMPALNDLGITQVVKTLLEKEFAVTTDHYGECNIKHNLKREKKSIEEEVSGGYNRAPDLAKAKAKSAERIKHFFHLSTGEMEKVKSESQLSILGEYLEALNGNGETRTTSKMQRVLKHTEKRTKRGTQFLLENCGMNIENTTNTVESKDDAGMQSLVDTVQIHDCIKELNGVQREAMMRLLIIENAGSIETLEEASFDEIRKQLSTTQAKGATIWREDEDPSDFREISLKAVGDHTVPAHKYTHIPVTFPDTTPRGTVYVTDGCESYLRELGLMTDDRTIFDGVRYIGDKHSGGEVIINI